MNNAFLQGYMYKESGILSEIASFSADIDHNRAAADKLKSDRIILGKDMRNMVKVMGTTGAVGGGVLGAGLGGLAGYGVSKISDNVTGNKNKMRDILITALGTGAGGLAGAAAGAYTGGATGATLGLGALVSAQDKYEKSLR